MMNRIVIETQTKTKSVVFSGPGIEFTTEEVLELAAALDELEASEFGHKVLSDVTHREAHSGRAEYEACRECNPDHFCEMPPEAPGEITPEPSPTTARKNKKKSAQDPPQAPKKVAKQGKGEGETDDETASVVTVCEETDDEEMIPCSQVPPKTPAVRGHPRAPFRGVGRPAPANDNANPAAPNLNNVS